MPDMQCFNSFCLRIHDEADPNIYSEDTLTVYCRGAVEFENVLGVTSYGMEVRYFDMGNGAQYEYQWKSDDRTFVLNDSIKNRLMTIEEVEDIINNISVACRDMSAWIHTENQSMGVATVQFKEGIKLTPTLMTNNSELIEIDCVDLKLPCGEERYRAVMKITNTERTGTEYLGSTNSGVYLTYGLVENHPITGENGYEVYYTTDGKYVSIALPGLDDITVLNDIVDNINIFCY